MGDLVPTMVKLIMKNEPIYNEKAKKPKRNWKIIPGILMIFGFLADMKG